MDVETSKKLAKKLGSHIDEFAMAVAAISCGTILLCWPR